MNQETTPISGPDVALAAGRGPAATLRRWLLATRPMFLTASVLPVLVGTAWGFSANGARLDVLVTLLALFATVCVHAASNVYNDVGDDHNGTDRDNPDRIYPFTGGSQFIQAGIMSADEMRRLAIGLFGLALIAGIVLTALKGVAIVVFGLIGIAAGILYSMPRVMLSGRGIGESVIGIAFGVLPVVGAAWLQSGVVDTDVVLVSVPVSLWVAAILLINEVPDRAADARAGKRTLPVRFGLPATRRLYLGMHLAAAATIGLMVWRGQLAVPALALAAVLLIPAFIAAGGITRAADDIPALSVPIRITLTIHAVGCLGLIAAIVLSS